MKTLNINKNISTLLLGTILLFIFNNALANSIIINKNSAWKYLDDGSDQGSNWRNSNFDDSSWSVGDGKLGFGDSNNATTINNHQSPTDTGAATWYFRKQFNIPNPSIYNNLFYRLLRDDGAIVYLNGVEIGRSNMPVGAVDFETYAPNGVSGTDERTYFISEPLSNTLLVGQNVIAVEVHQRSSGSSDVGFDFEFFESTDIVRGPYLQSQSPESIIIKWRTGNASNSQVKWGTQLDQLVNQVNNAEVGTEHEVLLTGLTPASKIYYSVGTSSETYVGNSQDYHFITPPSFGSKDKFRMWVIGDSGTANASAAAVKNAYLQLNGNTHTNLWIMLGDNAYGDGTDSEYQEAVFEMYPNLLQTSALWSTIGNHDSHNANSITQTGYYYDIFSLPKNAFTAGISTGADSGTEAYYSFDYGNVHFVVLESDETNSTFRTGMLNWLNDDLQLSSSDWTIALWHHPPYTKGTHDSDGESQLTYMRENVLEVLENRGVDLILTGHSHAYERSWLIDGHYGHSDTFNPTTHGINISDGNPNGDGYYAKATLGEGANQGTVYVVAGSSGKIGSGFTEAHEAMRNTLPLAELGSLVIDMDGGIMDVRFLNSTGDISDVFRIVKGDIIFVNGFEVN